VFRKYICIKQDSIKDCGVASLLTIIKVYKGDISKERLRILTKTSKNGTRAYDLMIAAEKMGFSAKGIKGNIDSLVSSNIVLPCIAHVVINKSYEHYVVIHKINKKKKTIIVADPSIGIREYTLDEFSNIWSGVLLILYPNKKILKLNNVKCVNDFLYELFINNINKLIVVFILSLIVTFCNIINSFYFKILIDNVIINKSYRNLYIISLVFILIIIFKISNDFIRKKILLYTNKKIDFTIFNDIFRHIVMLPYSYYKNRTTGEIISRINDLNNIKDLVAKIFLTLFIDIILIILVGIALYIISVNLFLVSTMFGIIYFIISIVFNSLFDKHINNIKNKEAIVASYLIESINSYETIKGLNVHDNIIDNIGLKFNNYINVSYQFNYLYNIQLSIKDILNQSTVIIILLVGSILVMEGDISLGTLLSFNTLLGYFYEPIKNIIDLMPTIKYATISLKRLLELYENESEQLDIDYKHQLNNLTGNIVINNLTFSYNDKDNILNNINLEINSGEKVLIVGSSGNGKSTLLKLIMRYYKVNNNSILLDDIDINNYSLNSIRNNVCYVSQHENLFTDSIYNNIVLDRKCDYDTFLKICKLTYVDKIYKNNPLTYDMLIEENGFNISGGERQRIIIARTVIDNRSIFLFDESLNEMNSELERKILLNILTLLKGKTILFVSHRVDNKDLFDKIVHIDNGIIKEIEFINNSN